MSDFSRLWQRVLRGGRGMETTESVAPPRQRLLAHFAMLAFSALVAGSFTTGALAVPYIEPVPLNALRFLVAALAMGIFVFRPGGARLALPAAPWRFAVMGVLMATYFVTMFMALKVTRPVATSAVYTLVPLLTAASAFFLVGQRAGPPVLLSLVLAALGALWVIFRGDVAALLRFEIGEGELIFFFGCLAYAIYTPLLKRFSRGETALVLSFWTVLASAICIALAGLPAIAATDWLQLPPVVWGTVLYLAIGSTAVCFFLIQFASLRLPASKVVAYVYLTPVFVILFEALAGHGWPSVSVAAGAAVTVLGLIVLARVRD